MTRIGKVFLCLLLFSTSMVLFAQKHQMYIKNYVILGLKNNLELQIASKRLEASKARYGQSKSSLFPRLDLTSRYTKLNDGYDMALPFGRMFGAVYDSLGITDKPSDLVIPMQSEKETETKLELTQPIFNPMIWFNCKVQNALTESDYYDFQSKQENVVFNIIESYFTVMQAEQMVKAKESSLALAKETHHSVASLYKEEKVPQTDLLRAEVMVMNSEQELQQMQNQFELARNHFNQILNRNMDEEVGVDSLAIDIMETMKSEDAFDEIPSYNEAISIANKNRPEVKQVNLAVRSAKYAKLMMASEFLPSVTMVADYGYKATDFNYNSNDDYWSVSGVLSINLFSGLGSSAKYKESRALEQVAYKSKEQTAQLILLDVKNNYFDYQNSIRQFEVAQKASQAAYANFNMVKKQYDNEMSSMVSYVDAKNLLDTSRSNLIAAYYNVLVIKAKLDKSLGIISGGIQ